jgi:GLPGLI family protein
MKNLPIHAVIGILYLLATVPVNAQKKVAELTIVYDYSIGLEGSEPKQPAGNETAIHTIYIKGSKSRSEMTNALFSSTTFYDANTGGGVILKEVSGQKLLIRLTADNWAERNNPYDGLVFADTSGSREIAGYHCVKAIGRTRSGATITVFYTKDILPQNRDYDPVFRNLAGLPLEYELANGNVKIRYLVSKINFNPVPASKFDIPKSGYREMNYEESKKSNLGG